MSAWKLLSPGYGLLSNLWIIPSYNKVHGRNIRERNNFPWYNSFQRRAIYREIHIKTHYKPTETFQYTHFTSCHPPGVKRGFIKGEAIRLLRINSSKTTFDESPANFKQRLEGRGYPKQDVERSLSEVNFDQKQSALKQKKNVKRDHCLSLQLISGTRS